MSFRTFRFLILCLGVALACQGHLAAQDLTTTDGQFYPKASLRRTGAMVMVKATLEGGTSSVEIGVPLARIAKVAFPEPPELAKAIDAASKANATEVDNLTGPFVESQEALKDLPGSWWPEMARLRLLALASLGKDRDCLDLARTIGTLNTPSADSLSRAGALFGPLATSDVQAVIVGVKAFPRIGGDQGSAMAQLALGRALLVKKDYLGALRAFLTIRVFYPSLALLQPPALNGASDAYLGLKDTKRAAQSLNDLATDWPDSPLAATAKKKAEGLSHP
jgi:hypothetical protein